MVAFFVGGGGGVLFVVVGFGLVFFVFFLINALSNENDVSSS